MPASIEACRNPAVFEKTRMRGGSAGLHPNQNPPRRQSSTAAQTILGKREDMDVAGLVMWACPADSNQHGASNPLERHFEDFIGDLDLPLITEVGKHENWPLQESVMNLARPGMEFA